MCQRAVAVVDVVARPACGEVAVAKLAQTIFAPLLFQALV
jgi:hypothetical protein